MLRFAYESRPAMLLVFVLSLIGCPAPEGTPVGGDGGADSGIDSGTHVGIDADIDAGPSDAGTCLHDADCDDGLYCNGVERCAPTLSCVVGTAPCMAMQTCDEAADRCVTGCDTGGDADGDGARSTDCGGDDCDDADSNRFPGHTEICEPAAHDEDCDPTTYGFRDADGDGSPDGNCCNVRLDGTRNCGGDCDDMAPGVHPSAPEVCDSRDQDCDTAIDEGVTAMLCHDADIDLHGDPSMTMIGCPGLVPGYVVACDDCDDALAAVSPGVPEACDNTIDDNCDTMVNEGCLCMTGDSRSCSQPGICMTGMEMCTGHGWGACSVMPAPYESCNMLDDDCNGVVDDGLRVDCYADTDNDGFAGAGTLADSLCRTAAGGCPVGYTTTLPTGTSIDCDDSSSARSPGNAESCAGIAANVDNDCDMTVDEGFTVPCYADADNDGYSPAGTSVQNVCQDASRSTVGYCPLNFTNRAPTGTATTDCNDNPAMNGGMQHPGLPEACDTLDNDCNGMVDDGTRVTCWVDGDDDTYALSGAMMSAAPGLCRDLTRVGHGYCPANWTSIAPSSMASRDCDDTMSSVHPFAFELCDSIDQNCNGMTSDAVMITCYADTDNDTYPRIGATSMMMCPVSGRDAQGGCASGFINTAPTTANGDCADSDPSIHPGITEMCSAPAVDQNCNGNTDEGLLTCYRDQDGDGYALAGTSSVLLCPVAARCPATYTSTAPSTRSDCDDSTATGNMPNHNQPLVTCYHDGDGDGWGTSVMGTQCPDGPARGGCAAGQTSFNGDCCDTDRNAFPGTSSFYDARDACSSWDWNCDGFDTHFSDATGANATCAGSSSSTCHATSPGTAGWVGGTVPACGFGGDYLDPGCAWQLIGSSFRCFPVMADAIYQTCH
jgi:hypothetical protein